MIENHGITIIRTNLDAADFNINKLINQIYRHIGQSNKLNLKKEQVKIKKLDDQNKELEDEIKKLKLQLTNLSVKNNEYSDDNYNNNDNNNSHTIKSKNTVSL